MTLLTVAHQGPLSTGILQAGILESVAMPFFRGPSPPRNGTCSMAPVLQVDSLTLSHQGSPHFKDTSQQLYKSFLLMQRWSEHRHTVTLRRVAMEDFLIVFLCLCKIGNSIKVWEKNRYYRKTIRFQPVFSLSNINKHLSFYWKKTFALFFWEIQAPSPITVEHSPRNLGSLSDSVLCTMCKCNSSWASNL